MVQGERARLSASAIQANPVSRYHAPATAIGRGRKRHDENTPRLKVICQSPGSIQRAAGTEPIRTMVNSAPAPADGKNCAMAMRTISSAIPECKRCVRVTVWTAIKAAETMAVETQIARYTGMRLAGLGSQTA